MHKVPPQLQPHVTIDDMLEEYAQIGSKNPRLDEITTPTVILAGAHDALFPPKKVLGTDTAQYDASGRMEGNFRKLVATRESSHNGTNTLRPRRTALATLAQLERFYRAA